MYQIQGEFIILTNSDGSVTCIPPDPNNTDYQNYTAWTAEGNFAQPVPTPPAPPVQPVQMPTLADVAAELALLQAQVAQLTP